jgi:indolepyruvate ferredoxin oxidoreductase alpha subunit
MPEQDSRLFAQWAGLPVLEPPDPKRAYHLTRLAFELSETSELPLIVRSVTSVAHEKQEVEAEYRYHPLGRDADFEKDIFRFTKAGAAICVAQHEAALKRLEAFEEAARVAGLNRLHPGEEEKQKGLFVVASGSLIPYVSEALAFGDHTDVSTVFLESLYPLDRQIASRMFSSAKTVLVLEELEPFVEMLLRSEASLRGWQGTILGKLDGLLPRTGKYSQEIIAAGLRALKEAGLSSASSLTAGTGKSAAKGDNPDAASQRASARQGAGAQQQLGVKHPITFCAGCPHRGSFMAINRALKKIGLDKDNTVVTGDIGCTILGMNPPFHTCWTEVSMGASIGLAQGFLRAGIEHPLIATIGDSTFFHAGIPPLVNAVQHGTDILVIILDNGWTSMTGFQVNPGTDEQFQAQGSRRVDIEAIVRGVGVRHLMVIDPFDQEQSVQCIAEALKQDGVKVIISRRECALPVSRRQKRTLIYRIDADACTFCRACLRESGCPALSVSANGKSSKQGQIMKIDPDLCTGCGLCATCCKFDAIHEHRLEE